jgi:mevalonate kinase
MPKERTHHRCISFAQKPSQMYTIAIIYRTILYFCSNISQVLLCECSILTQEKYDLFVIKLLKLVFAFFMAIETASIEREVQRLQEKNRQIKETAKQIMTTSQHVSAELRSGDIEKICTVLDEYELQLEQVCSVLPSSPIIETLSQISPQR